MEDVAVVTLRLPRCVTVVCFTKRSQCLTVSARSFAAGTGRRREGVTDLLQHWRSSVQYHLLDWMLN
jgi:hypothetical protein